MFLSYGDAADQVTALRLQALGAVSGLTVYVPPAHTRQQRPAVLDPKASQELSDAEGVLGFIGNGLSEACLRELNTGVALHKNTIVMAYPHLAQQLQPYFGPNLVVMDPVHPDQSESELVRQLRHVDAAQTAKKALLGLGTLVLGLVILAGPPLPHDRTELSRVLERLRNPKPGGKVEAAYRFGVDVTLLIEQIQLSPAERADRMHSLAVAAEAVRGAAAKTKHEL